MFCPLWLKHTSFLPKGKVQKPFRALTFLRVLTTITNLFLISGKED